MAVTQLGTVMMRMGVDTRAWYKGLGDARKGLVTFGASMQVTGLRMSAAFTSSLGLMGAAAIKASKDWETAFTGVRKTVEATEEQFKLLEAGFRSLAKIMPLTHEELARLGEVTGQLGVRTGDLLGFVEAVSKLGIAAEDLTAEEAAFKLAQMMNVMGTGKERVDELAAVIVRLGNDLATTEGRIVAMADRFAGTAAIIGLTESQTLALAGAMAAMGLRIESAGTAISRVMIAINKEVETSGEKLALFASVANMSAEDFATVWSERPMDALFAFISGLKGIKDQGDPVFAVLEKLDFDQIRLTETLLKTSLGTDVLSKALKLAGEEVAFFDAGMVESLAHNVEYAKRAATLESRIKMLWNRFYDAAIVLGDALRPAVELVMKAMTGLAVIAEQLAMWFTGLDEKTRLYIVAAAGVLAALGPLMLAMGVFISLIAAIGVEMLVGIGVLAAFVFGLTTFTKAAGGVTQAILLVLDGAKLLIRIVVGAIEIWNEWGWVVTKFVAIMKWANPLFILWRLNIKLVNAALEGLIAGIRFFTPEVEDMGEGAVKATQTINDLQEMVKDLAASLENGTAANKYKERLAEIKRGLKDTEGGAADLLDKLRNLHTGTSGSFDFGTEEADKYSKSLATLADEMRNLAGVGLAEELRKITEAASIALQEIGSKRMGGAMQERFSAMLESVWSRAWNSPVLRDQVEATAQFFGFTLGHSLAERIGLELRKLKIIDIPPGTVEFPLIDFFDVPPGKTALEWLEFFGVAEQKAVNWSAALRDLSRAFKLLGVDADSALGRIIGGMVVAASASDNLFKALSSLTYIARDPKTGITSIKISWEHVTTAIMAGAEAVGAFMAATESASASARALGGLMTGAQIGGALGGGWGALAGAGIGALIGYLRTPGWVKQIEMIGEKWGIALSGGLAKKIEETNKELDVGRYFAFLLHLGDVWREAGGAATVSMKDMVQQFHQLVAVVRSGAVNVGDGLLAINDAFAAMAESFEVAGIAGAFAIGKMLAAAERAGTVTKSMTEFIEKQVTSALAHLTVFFDSFIVELEGGVKSVQITAEEATGVLAWMGAAFAAALKSTGNLYEAILLLPDSFRQLLPALREILGENDALLNLMTDYYNFVQDNSKTLGALSALSGAFKALVSINVINIGNIDALAESFHQLFLDLGDNRTALIMMGPQIGMLYRAFEKLGLDAPQWLKDLRTAAIEAGASLEPPPSVVDVLEQIRDIIREIAVALGVAFGKSEALNTSLGGGPTGGGGGGGGKSGPKLLAGGLPPTIFTRPATFTVGEAGPELMQVIPLNNVDTMGGLDAPIVIPITLTLDGRVIEKKIVRTVASAHRTGDLDLTSELVDPRA